MNATSPLLLALALGAATACRPDDQRTDSIDPVEAMQRRENFEPGVVAHLDSANTLFRADRHEEALAHYRLVTELSPDVAAGWFGTYMAQHALGNETAALQALERAQSSVPGATLLHPTTADTIR